MGFKHIKFDGTNYQQIVKDILDSSKIKNSNIDIYKIISSYGIKIIRFEKNKKKNPTNVKYMNYIPKNLHCYISIKSREAYNYGFDKIIVTNNATSEEGLKFPITTAFCSYLLNYKYAKKQEHSLFYEYYNSKNSSEDLSYKTLASNLLLPFYILEPIIEEYKKKNSKISDFELIEAIKKEFSVTENVAKKRLQKLQYI